jgi:hypothetical protein
MTDRPSTKLYHPKVVRTKIKHLTPHQGTFSSILNARKLMTHGTNRAESNGIIAPMKGNTSSGSAQGMHQENTAPPSIINRRVKSTQGDMKGHINKIAKKKADDHWHILCLKIDLEQHNGSSSRSKTGSCTQS